MNLLYILLASILSAILYRIGGAKGYNTKYRDLGCPFVLLILICILFGFYLHMWWLYLLFILLSMGALSTYWDKLFGCDNFYAHGLGCGLATLPLIWCGVPWWVLTIRLIVCTVGMGVWSKLVGNDVAEECGRGVIFIV